MVILLEMDTRLGRIHLSAHVARLLILTLSSLAACTRDRGTASCSIRAPGSIGWEASARRKLSGFSSGLKGNRASGAAAAAMLAAAAEATPPKPPDLSSSLVCPPRQKAAETEAGRCGRGAEAGRGRGATDAGGSSCLQDTRR